LLILLAALNHFDDFPALGFAEWACLSDANNIPDVTLIGLVVGVEFVGFPNDLAIEGMRFQIIYRDNHSLIHLIAHHAANLE
jgi:hypothetical protein